MTDAPRSTADPDTPAPDSEQVLVWDPVVRVGHWVLVAAFAIAYLTEGEPAWLHTWAGYAIVVTVILRVIWGFIGPEHARFASFVRGPGAALGYLRDELRGTAHRFLGHNPAAGLMAVALLVCLGATTWTGMAMLAETGEGPLAPVMGPAAVASVYGVGPAHADDDDHEDDDHGGHGADHEQWEDLHAAFANMTLGLIALHVLGAIAGSLAHRENLVRAMIDGRKRAER